MIMEVNDLKKYFVLPSHSSKNIVHAVDGVSFNINRGKTLGFVGESGCGKTTVGRCILRLIEPDSGKISFNDKDILKVNGYGLRTLRKEMQIIFQDPFSSLDPRKTVFQLVSEPFIIHKLGNKKIIKDNTLQVLKSVGLGEADIIGKYPHELDGGRCQRIGIARALATNPKFIVCDEPVSALDVSLQAQILNLLVDLQKKFSLTYLFISHNMAVIKHICDYIMVMYLGKIMECASKYELFNNPIHPYTKALLEAVPSITLQNKKHRVILAGDVPTPINPGPGCRFEERCSISIGTCKKLQPSLVDIGNNHKVACFQVNK